MTAKRSNVSPEQHGTLQRHDDCWNHGGDHTNDISLSSCRCYRKRRSSTSCSKSKNRQRHRSLSLLLSTSRKQHQARHFLFLPCFLVIPFLVSGVLSLLTIPVLTMVGAEATFRHSIIASSSSSRVRSGFVCHSFISKYFTCAPSQRHRRQQLQLQQQNPLTSIISRLQPCSKVKNSTPYHALSLSLKEEEIVQNAGEENFPINDVSPKSPLTTRSDDTESAQQNQQQQQQQHEYSFFDEAVIHVRAGSGGQGSSTHKKRPHTTQNGPPDGGDGGRGGSVYLRVDEGSNTLAGLTNAWRPNSFGGSGSATTFHGERRTGGGGGGGGNGIMSFRAENGQDGGRQFKNGRYGKDVVIHVPPGTVVQEEKQEVVLDDSKDGDCDDQNDERSNTTTRTKLIDLGSVTSDKPIMLVAKGGEGGEGSAMTNAGGGGGGKQGGRGIRRPRLPPTGGEKKRLKLTLKVVADVALVGVPNAGKSTFLAAVTRAKPKIANYPFTTVIPNLGVWIPPEADFGGSRPAAVGEEGGGGKRSVAGAGSSGLVLCDVPGLIEGAAEGAGLGHAFLRHVERCHVILHLVDATSDDPLGDFDVINREILGYGNGKLARMPQIVVVNKVDAWEDSDTEGLKPKMTREELEEKLRGVMSHSRLMWMSAKEKDGVDDLMARMAGFVKKVKEASS